MERERLGRGLWMRWRVAEWTQPGSWVAFRRAEVSRGNCRQRSRGKTPRANLWTEGGDGPGAGRGLGAMLTGLAGGLPWAQSVLARES